jgi:hypothetical protein
MLLQTKMKTLNYRVLIGITLLANRTERQQCSITIYNESLARMEKMIEMGFTEGYKMSMNNLENVLATLSGK